MTCWWRARLVLIAVAVTTSAAPALAKDKPKPSLSIEPIAARDLLAPSEPNLTIALTDDERERRTPTYRLGEPNIVTGQRARLSVELGDTTVFAITGRLGRRGQQGPPDPTEGLQRKTGSGKVYGAGLERRIGPVDLSTTYQYSRASNERSESVVPTDNPKSHNVRATARIRFRP